MKRKTTKKLKTRQIFNLAMKQKISKKLRIHQIFNIIISAIFIIAILINRDATLFTSVIFLVVSIVGNGIIHGRNDSLTRDTIIEYVIVAIIALVILLGSIIK